MRRYDLSCFSEIENARTMSSFSWANIPAAFRLGRSAYETITLYKGAQRGLENIGFPSHAIEHGKQEKIEQVRRIVEGDHDRIRQLIEDHTSANSLSSLLSTTFNPEMAQVFAPHRMGSDYTIYEVRVPANRCIYDKYDTGYCGRSGEVLILGAIFSDEISAVKIDNTDFESELLFKDQRGASLIRDKPEMRSTNRLVKNPNNWHRR